MSVLLTIISVVLIIISILTLFSVILLLVMYWKIRQMREEIDVIFNAAANCEEFLAGMSADRGFDYSAN